MLHSQWVDRCEGLDCWLQSASRIDPFNQSMQCIESSTRNAKTFNCCLHHRAASKYRVTLGYGGS